MANEQFTVTYVPEEERKKKKFGIKSKILVLTAFVLAIFLAVILYVTLRKSTKNIRNEFKDVHIKTGSLRGKLTKSNLGGNVIEYLGIPYAKPPIGDLRFSDPVPPENWNGVLDAFEHGNSCVCYIDKTFGSFVGSNMWNPSNRMNEDCLYLNVWQPETTSIENAKLPVMVWIYGGGYYSGSSQLEVYDGKVLADSQKVIVVSFNYRLGPFGFLTTGDDRISGNFGLKDQQLALKWVHENIASFGGDPNEVTIFGESAGSVSVGLHLSLPGSAKYFKRAIMQSGAPNCYWAILTKEQAIAKTEKFLKIIGCKNDAHLKVCLRFKDADFLNDKMWMEMKFFYIPFAPYLDGKFIKRDGYDTLVNGLYQNKSLIVGTNINEGTFWIVYTLLGFFKYNSSEIDYETYKKNVKLALWDLHGGERFLFIFDPKLRKSAF
ncbi:DgyrCDS10688 [Dimorphilus gyrociliatus]|uniref:Carboxylic ester hydrolase n=1 Tax=Dimorphilus gyrociliatus TaxID=2664684 RepID=A0A7I8W0Y7_9ANNE|nr:DgyrCDS10688 [Dimorphilus gyrociliatus]